MFKTNTKELTVLAMRLKYMEPALIIGLLLSVSIGVGAQAPVDITFYYPVQVAGPLAMLMDELVAEFNDQNPHIRVEPVYSGDYYQTMQKAQTAVMSRNAPDVA